MGCRPWVKERGSVKAKFRVDRAPSPRRYSVDGGDAHGVKFAVQRLAPEIQKALKLGEFWRKIEVLPDEALQQARMIGHTIQNLGGR